MDDPEPSPLADGPHSAVGGTSVEALAVAPMEDRARAALAEDQVDRAGHPWDEGDDCRLVALADDAQRAVTLANPRSSASVAQASLTRSPFRPRSTARAAWSWS